MGSENNLENSSSTSQLNTSMAEYSEVTGNKIKACINLRSPRKRQRSVPELARETVVAKGTKRKSSTTTEAPSKKRRSGKADTNTHSEPTKVSVESERKEEASVEQMPAAETPWMMRMETGCNLSSSSSCSSTSRQNNWSMLTSVKNSKDFEAKYLQLDKLGEGGFGSVYAGTRKSDNLRMAIKHIPKVAVESRPVVLNDKTYMVPSEVFLMMRVSGGAGFVGKCAPVSLLDWFDLDQEVLLVMERPVPFVDLLNYLNDNNGPLEEDQAKNIMKQLVEAAINMHSQGVLHRDIKAENILIETVSDVPLVRIIDFGCSCLIKKTPYRHFSGTSAYAPPEFFIQGRYQAGPTTVWQLGALLYELLDGYTNFSTSNFLHTKVRFISELNKLNVSQDCKDLLKACLTVNPKKRATLEQMQLHPWFA